MKTKLIITLAVLGFAALIGIRIATYQSEEKVDPEDVLVISAYVFDQTTTEATVADSELTTLAFREIALGEKWYTSLTDWMVNINFGFDFVGGTIEVESEACDVQLSVDRVSQPWYDAKVRNGRQFGSKLSVADGGYIAVNPVRSGQGILEVDNDIAWDTSENYAGREHMLIVRAYSSDDRKSPLVTAEIRLTQLGCPDSPDEIMTGYYSIELISYAFSDIHEYLDE